MKNRDLKFGMILAAVVFCRPALAPAAYEDVGVSARAVGMGNAFTAVADDVYAIHYNPAGLATLDRPELAVSYAKLMTGLSDNSNIQNSFLAYESPIQEGRLGTAGIAWNQFSLESLYKENSIYGSYGRELFETYYPHKFFGGISLKYLNRAVGAVDVADRPLNNTGAVVAGSDPVLKSASRSNLDVDLGFLWHVRPRWNVGLMAQHFLEPNIAFSSNDTDRLGRNVKLGGAYRTPFSTLASDLDFTKAPDGSLDKTVSFAAEKWLPTLLHGTFGMRGSLGVGTRDYRQFGLGVSYKIFRMQFDYGFTIPLGGLATSGSHRLGLTYRFGRSRAPQATLSEAVLENIRDLADVGTPEFRYQMEELTLFKRTAIEEFLRQAKVDVGSGRFAEALTKINEVAGMKPGDAKILESQSRLKAVAGIYAEIRDFFTDPVQASIYDGALKFLGGKDKDALGNLAYAKALNPGDGRIEALMRAIEAKSGLSREVPAAAPAVAVSSVTAGETVAVSTVAVSSAAVAAAPVPEVSPEQAAAARTKQLADGYMALMEVAFRQFEYDKVIELAKQVLELDNSNVLAYKRMGAAYHSLKRYPEALAALESAFRLERDTDARKTLRSYIDALAGFIRRSQEPVAAKPRPKAVRPSAMSPRDIERVYENGVDFYSRGMFSDAAAAFRQVLEADPRNVPAQKALRRVEAELIQSGERR
ncbi:MAG: type IX secretion system membrane protein PorP/SprF [Elusimicrobiota bacterium]|jgi:tetratricopeptide (TPR) repeat protein